MRRHYLRWFKKKSVPVLECKRGFKDDGNDDEEKNSSEEEDTSDDCKDGGGDGGIHQKKIFRQNLIKLNMEKFLPSYFLQSIQRRRR